MIYSEIHPWTDANKTGRDSGNGFPGYWNDE